MVVTFPTRITPAKSIYSSIVANVNSGVTEHVKIYPTNPNNVIIFIIYKLKLN